MMSGRLVLLGGDGFLGKTIVSGQVLFNDVLAISRFPTAHPKATELVVDDPASLGEGVFESATVVFNCLGIAHRGRKASGDLYNAVNRDLALAMARRSKRAGARLFVQMSSLAVYGDIESIDPSTVPCPVTDYGMSKAKADEGLLAMQDSHFRVLILRPPMIYGPGAPGNMGKLIRLAKALPVLPFADADEPRVSLCSANFLRLAESAIESSLGCVVLLKDRRNFATRELLEIILDELGKEKRFVRMPLRGLVGAIAPSVIRKLFGGLSVQGALEPPLEGQFALVDPESELRSMVRTYAEGHQ